MELSQVDGVISRGKVRRSVGGEVEYKGGALNPVLACVVGRFFVWRLWSN